MAHSPFCVTDLLEPRGEFGAILRSILAEMQPSSSHLGATGCLLADIAEYLTFFVAVLSEIAAKLVRGRHIREYIERKFQEMKHDDDYTDLSPVDNLASNRDTLDCIISDLQKCHHSVSSHTQGIKRLLPPSSRIRSDRPSFSSSLSSPTRHMTYSPAQSRNLPSRPGNMLHRASDPGTGGYAAAEAPHTPRPRHHSASTPTYTNQIAEAPDLTRRGKGTYTCPWGSECTKGGVDNQGYLRVFEQNSAFRAHLNKHDKPWRCDNCAKKAAFARKDQLERHRATCGQPERK